MDSNSEDQPTSTQNPAPSEQTEQNLPKQDPPVEESFYQRMKRQDQERRSKWEQEKAAKRAAYGPQTQKQSSSLPLPGASKTEAGYPKGDPYKPKYKNPTKMQQTGRHEENTLHQRVIKPPKDPFQIFDLGEERKKRAG